MKSRLVTQVVGLIMKVWRLTELEERDSGGGQGSNPAQTKNIERGKANAFVKVDHNVFTYPVLALYT